jgi:hypothetical protein
MQQDQRSRGECDRKQAQGDSEDGETEDRSGIGSDPQGQFLTHT